MAADIFSLIPASPDFEALLSEGPGGRVFLVSMGVSHEQSVKNKEVGQTNYQNRNPDSPHQTFPGATLAELQKATGWQAHSVRGAISGTLRKKLGLAVTIDETGKRGRFYCISQSSEAGAKR